MIANTLVAAALRALDLSPVNDEEPEPVTLQMSSPTGGHSGRIGPELDSSRRALFIRLEIPEIGVLRNIGENPSNQFVVKPVQWVPMSPVNDEEP